MSQAVWTVERTVSRKLPFRIAIEQGGRRVLAVRAQSSWPGPGQQIFCLREHELDPAEPLEPLERATVVNLTRVGRKLAVVLDRPTRKRCEFLVVRKTAQDGHEYEQIFFRTESGIKAHRSRTRVELLPEARQLTIAIDSAEKYPWRFPGAVIQRRRLPAGDYALIDGARTTAVVERKTFDGLLGDLGRVQALHHQLADLAGLPVAVVVVEAQYGDFLDPARLAGRWPPAYLARVLAEVSALHPRLPVVFAGNRKLANAWCAAFFNACATSTASPQLDLVSETLARYDAPARGPGIDEQLRAAALARNGEPFTTRDIMAGIENATLARARRVLERLAAEGLLRRSGERSGTRWTKAGGQNDSA